MRKFLVAAAACAALTAGFAGQASAGVTGGQLSGLKSTGLPEVTQVHYKRHYYKRHFWKRWHHHRHLKCVWRHGHKHCWR